MNGERWKKASEWGLWKMNGTSENENIVMERVLDRSSRLFLIEQCKILNWILRNGVITLFNINSTIDRKDCNNYYCRMRRIESSICSFKWCPFDYILQSSTEKDRSQRRWWWLRMQFHNEWGTETISLHLPSPCVTLCTEKEYSNAEEAEGLHNGIWWFIRFHIRSIIIIITLWNCISTTSAW